MIFDGIFVKPKEEIKCLVFLDIDGVLCNFESFASEYMSDLNHPFNSECVKNLEYIIEQTEAHIVISSSWRKRDIDWIRGIFKNRDFKYYDRIIGETMRGYTLVEKGHHLPIPRGVEVKAWYDTYIRYDKDGGFSDKNIPYVILDDDTDFLLCQLKKFVNTDTKIGLTRENADKAVLILKC